ncbi:MAG TPA: hypothetical protein VMA96_13685 [Solirubrobacteraceae bacterium]|nr:hypothetical protein [Solirubrobacteraceae bacterium]
MRTELGRQIDAVVRLLPPDGQRLTLLVEAKRLLNARDVPIALEQLRNAGWAGSGTTLNVLVARYLAPSTRERIAQEGAGYIDATGNIRITTDRPALFVSDRGADRDPWRGPGRPRATLQGPPAARVVRALVDFTPPYTVPELIKRARTSNGATYRVVEFLEQEDLLVREPYGQITEVRWRPLLMRWSQDYGFSQSNTVATFLEPRGLTALKNRLVSLENLDYVLTGSLATELVTAYAPYAPPRLAMLYVNDIGIAKRELGLREAESGGNVALAATEYDVVFERSETVGKIKMAALSQVAVDLLSGPGRNPTEAVALLDWMEGNERSWRR